MKLEPLSARDARGLVPNGMAYWARGGWRSEPPSPPIEFIKLTPSPADLLWLDLFGPRR